MDPELIATEGQNAMCDAPHMCAWADALRSLERNRSGYSACVQT